MQAGMRKTHADLGANMNLDSYHRLGFKEFRRNHLCPLCLPQLPKASKDHQRLDELIR